MHLILYQKPFLVRLLPRLVCNLKPNCCESEWQTIKADTFEGDKAHFLTDKLMAVPTGQVAVRTRDSPQRDRAADAFKKQSHHVLL